MKTTGLEACAERPADLTPKGALCPCSFRQPPHQFPCHAPLMHWPPKSCPASGASSPTSKRGGGRRCRFRVTDPDVRMAGSAECEPVQGTGQINHSACNQGHAWLHCIPITRGPGHDSVSFSSSIQGASAGASEPGGEGKQAVWGGRT